PEGFYAGFDHFRDRACLGEVANMALNLVTRFFHQGKRFRKGLLAAVDGEDFRAFLGEAHRGGAAVAPAGPDRAGAADDGDFSLKAFFHGDYFRKSRRTSAPEAMVKLIV